MRLQRILESKVKIRFQDCDPFNHLNNAAYFNYFINAREDQVIENYDLDIYKHGQETGKSWVVASHQIAYIKPATLQEIVTIQTQVINYGKKNLSVELKMWNKDKTELKAIMWSSFVYVDLRKSTAASHSDELLALFEQALAPVEEQSFEERVVAVRAVRSV